MRFIDLIRVLPEGQGLGDIAYCWLTPTGQVYYSACKYMYDMYAFAEKFGFLDELTSVATFLKAHKWPTAFEFLVDRGYAYLYAGETVRIYPDAAMMEHGWYYKKELLTSIQKQKIFELTGDVVE